MNKFHIFINTMRSGAKTAFSKVYARRMLMLMVAVVCAVSPALAADGIAGKLTEIGANFKGYVEPVRNIVYALAAICAVIGAFTIYFKMTNGEQDVKCDDDYHRSYIGFDFDMLPDEHIFSGTDLYEYGKPEYNYQPH